jgi:hypothetical protein
VSRGIHHGLDHLRFTAEFAAEFLGIERSHGLSLAGDVAGRGKSNELGRMSESEGAGEGSCGYAAHGG